MSDAILVLSDGSVFHGRSFGAAGTSLGEVVFNTAMSGYQEVLTDPSYHGQIVAMTYPHQGNYGVNSLDEEAARPWVRAFVARDVVDPPSSWRAGESLGSYLNRHGVVGITEVDTRRLTRRLRSAGAMQGGVSTELDPPALLDAIRAAPGIVGVDLAREVTTATAYDADSAELLASGGFTGVSPSQDARGMRIAAVDFGMKRHILRCLAARGLTVRVFPATATAAQIRDWNPDGVFLSNGPGDPQPLTYAVDTIRSLLDAQTPIFGICLGHQLLGTALGATTYKLKFGHRGANHPVKSLATGRVEVTVQNHGFAVATGLDASGADATPWQALSRAQPGEFKWESRYGDVHLTHFDLNDGTLEGLRALDVPAYSVQYHPEAAPGPHDAQYLFDDFVRLVGGL